MNEPPRPPLPPMPPNPSASPLESAVGWLLAWIGWALVALVGLVFIASLLLWVVVLVAFSVIAGWITGRPSTVALLWRHYRDLMRGRWPQTPGKKRSTTPRADAVQATAPDDTVQDVHWRDVPDDKHE